MTDQSKRLFAQHAVAPPWLYTMAGNGPDPEALYTTP